MNLIVAVDNNWAIGKSGGLIYHLPADLRFFKETTNGKVVIMGDKTLLSLPNGKPLPNRTNIIMSLDNIQVDGAIVCHSTKDLEKAIASYDNDEVFVIGGAYIYSMMLPYCKRAFITKIDASTPDADKFFPNLDKTPGWKLTNETETMTDNGLNFKFTIYENSQVKEL